MAAEGPSEVGGQRAVEAEGGAKVEGREGMAAREVEGREGVAAEEVAG